jgi:membrane-anchored protein YejM (alkaline phosphatase superfamily)
VPHHRTLFVDEGLRERLYAALPLDVRLADAADQAAGSGPEAHLVRRLNDSYRERFGALKNQSSPVLPHFSPGVRPHIVFLVVESFREDALSAALMPRLFHWGQSEAHSFQEHSAGTYSSEAGMFSLLYGRNNLTFHETLDAGVPPLLFTWLRSLNYEISYYTGHPIEWLRREEFLSADSVDRLVHDDAGEWPDWDKRALGAMTRSVAQAKRPTFSLVFLMSTHFEYQYPPRYERHLPVAKSKFRVTDVNAMGEADRIPHLNRYKNSVGFLDDALMDAIERLPEEALIVVVGDHGEAFFEGGNYGHGFSFTDPVLEVPLLIRFPQGAPGLFESPRLITERTLHTDVIGWVARYLNGAPLFLDGFEGNQDWSAGRPSVLFTYADPGRKQVYGMLSLRSETQGEIRARLLFLSDEPRLRLLGFEQQFGLPVAAPRLDPSTIDLISRSFERELARVVQ